MTDEELCGLAKRMFADSPRPEHFTNYGHCSECKDHDDLLCSRDLDTLNIDDINKPGWQPVCFLNSEGWLYYFPAFVRLTFENLEDSFLDQFLFFLCKPEDEDFSLFNQEQKHFVLTFLRHVQENHADLVERESSEHELRKAIVGWEVLIGE